MEDIRELIECVEHAESEVYRLMSAVEEMRGYQNILKRADTILGKLEGLKWQLIGKDKVS